MNNQDKAREPSMDEILASIRQIIAEEPSDARADGEGNANPLLTGTELRNDRSSKSVQLDDRPRPSADRLSSALKARAMAPPPPPPAGRPFEPFGIKASSNLDEDLSDLLDEPSASSVFSGGSSSKHEPIALNGVEDAHPFFARSTFADGAAAVAADDELDVATNGRLNGEYAEDMADAEEPIDIAARQESAYPAPIELPASSPARSAENDATPTAQPAPAASPFASLRRKNGFWPPQPQASATPGSAQATAAQSAVNGSAFPPGSGPWPAPEVQRQANAAAPSSTADLIARLHAGLTERPAEPDPPQVQFSAPPVPETHLNGAAYAVPPLTPLNYVPPYTAARTPDPAPIPVAPTAYAPVVNPPIHNMPASNGAAADPYARPMTTEALMEAALASLVAAGGPPPAVRDAYGRVMPASEPPRAPYADPYTQGYASQRPDPAAAALDALAHGLAAPQRADMRRAYDSYQPAQQYQSHTALVAQPLPPAVQDYYPQAIRTLEDAVADMLKPMLQKWLADNMPRIIERALRVEAASGMKPPGAN